MYKLIALDMDETLLDQDKTISKENIEALKEAQNMGVKVILATGRPISGIRKYFNDLGFKDDNFIVCFNGAMVSSINEKINLGGEVIYGSDLKALDSLSKDLNVNIHAFDKRGCISPKCSEYTRLEVELNNIPLNITDFSDVNDDDYIIKVMFIDEPETLDKAIKKMPSWVYEKYNTVKSAPFFLEMLNKKADKWYGVKRVADYYNIKVEEIMCFGDSENDQMMIKEAGMGVAMENALPCVKDVAKYITKSNVSNGVAYAVNKFIINSSK